MGRLTRTVSQATSLLPSTKIKVPYRGDWSIWLSVYADRELAYALNMYEPEVVRTLKTLLENASVVADVGAHMGIYSLLALERGCEVHSFEPHPDNAERIRDHVRMNGFETDSTVIEAAVTDSIGEAALAIHDSTTRHSVNHESNNSLSVQTTTLDSHFGNKTPDLVKIDVEGAGADVLEGARSILQEGKTTWIMEIHNSAERTAFTSAFDREDFEITRIGDNHLLARPISGEEARGDDHEPIIDQFE